MTLARQLLGRTAENAAASRLAREGYSILARNVRIRRPEIRGEIDLIALDRAALVFVEVKAGRIGAQRGPERPALAVGRRKQAKLRRLARAWLAERPVLPRFASVRFDVVGMRVDAVGRMVGWEHLRAAF